MHRTREKMSKGINHTFEKTDPKYEDYRFLFFETDKPYVQQDYTDILKVYDSHNLDLLVHNTGGGGQHFISPTVITVKEWKEMIDILRDINPRFPALVLRILPNKYVDERQQWFKSKDVFNHEENILSNSFELCNELRRWFGSKLFGIIRTDLKIRNYPLPCIYCNRRIGKNHVCHI